MRLPVIESTDRIAAEVVSALKPHLRGDVRASPVDRGMFAVDASLYEAEPIAVVAPKNADDVAVVVEYCRDHGLPILGRGAGTSLAGQSVNTAVVLDFSKYMNRVLEIDSQAMQARVEPGLVLDSFNRALAPQGLTFGPDVSTSTHATLGGMIMNASAGAYSLINGMTDEHVLAMDVILADGRRLHLAEGGGAPEEDVQKLLSGVVEIVEPLAEEITRRYPKVPRNTGGYRLDDVLGALATSKSGVFDRVNLARFLSGSEGTLGLMTEATVKVLEAPREVRLLVIGFASVSEACECVESLVASGAAAVELMDETIIHGAAGQPVHAHEAALLPQIRGELPGAVLMVEYRNEACSNANSVAREYGERAAIFDDAVSQSSIWSIRKVGLGIISNAPGPRKALPGLEDCAVPLDQLVAFQSALDQLIREHGTDGVFYAHASVGLLHVRPRFDLSDQSDRASYLELMDQVLELVIAHGGAISGEHGDGRIRANLMRRFYGETLCEAFLAIKRLFDPKELLNPGDKVAERDPMGELRQTAEEPTEETFFHWAQGGPLAAAQECNGNGLCRRAEGGAMCPSYRALLDERHVTRGRAAALKLAMEGRLAGGEVDWNNPDVQETLSLCLSCKACRSECPSNVDVGKLKAEYTAQGFASGHGPTFATRAMANLGALARRASSLHPLPTWALAIPGVEAAVKACVGVASSRRLPRPVRSLSRGTHGADGPTVVLFPDCFASSFEPWIAEAAQRTLSALGYRVVVPSGSWCCGRTALSCGVLKEARLSIERTASELFQAVKASDALAVIVLEPSCLSAIQEEWLELKTDLDPAVANELAERACSLEHFLLEHAGKHPHAVEPRSNDVLHVVHPHCHAKVVREELGLALRLLGVERVEVLDNGCCGMAGAFGYMKKTEPLSRTIAQQSLGPAMNGLEDAILVAPGTSCRHQVADCFGRRALHPAEVAALAIAPESVPSTT